MNAKQVIDEFILYATAKYNNPKATINALNGFLTGRSEFITRDRDFRNRLCQLNKADIINILGISTDNYVMQTLNNNVVNQPVQQYEQKSRSLSVSVYNKFYEVCHDLISRTNVNQLIVALSCAQRGNYDYLPNGEVLSQIISPEDIYLCCRFYLSNFNYDFSKTPNIIEVFASALYEQVKRENQMKQY